MGASVKDVAARAGVSVGTVSNVLNRPDAVAPDTAERVKAAIAELGYVPNAAARQLRIGQSTAIAFIVLDVSNPFFTDVLRGAEIVAEEHGQTILLANSGVDAQRESAHVSQFERQRVGGVLLVPTGVPDELIARLRRTSIPVVLVDRVTDDRTVASVAADDRRGGALAAEHLLTLGRRRIVFVGSAVSVVAIHHRVEGARAAAAGAGLEIQHVHTRSLTLEDGAACGPRIAAMVLSGQCDAVIAANDMVAIGLQQALLSGDVPVRIPQDVALVGYDDISFAAACVVPITSVRQPRMDMGRIAMELLLRESELADGASREHIVLEPTLTVRASTDPNASRTSGVVSA